MLAHNYPMSFTTGGLFRIESITMAELYMESKDWWQARAVAIEQNLLQTRTYNSLVRFTREVMQRLKSLHDEELSFLLSADEREQRYLLWVAVCRTYPFIAEFARQVLRENYLGTSGRLQEHDFESFFNEKADWKPELERITPATRNKLRTVLFRIMREADLLSEDNVILGALFAPDFIRILRDHSPEDILFFPVSDIEARELIS